MNLFSKRSIIKVVGALTLSFATYGAMADTAHAHKPRGLFNRLTGKPNPGPHCHGTKSVCRTVSVPVATSRDGGVVMGTRQFCQSVPDCH